MTDRVIVTDGGGGTATAVVVALLVLVLLAVLFFTGAFGRMFGGHTTKVDVHIDKPSPGAVLVLR